MIYNQIKCEAIKVNTESGVCPGVAETKLGEVYTIGARTPAVQGICCQAFTAISS